MIEIMSLRRSKVENEFDARVDRASVLGNPFVIRKDGDRDMVCNKYGDWFRQQFKHNPRFKSEVIRLVGLYRKHGKLRLFCWCAPKRCHAEFIAEVIEYIVKVQDSREAACSIQQFFSS